MNSKLDAYFKGGRLPTEPGCKWCRGVAHTGFSPEDIMAAVPHIPDTCPKCLCQCNKMAERVAKAFHETYERLAPEHAYETRKASALPWESVPSNNKRLMIAVARELIWGGVIEAFPNGTHAVGEKRTS